MAQKRKFDPVAQARMILEGDGSPADNIQDKNVSTKEKVQEGDDVAAEGGEGTKELKTPSEKPDADEKSRDGKDLARNQNDTKRSMQEARRRRLREDQMNSPTGLEPEPDAPQNPENDKAAQVTEDDDEDDLDESDKPGEVQPDSDDYESRLASGALAEDDDEDDLDESDDEDEDDKEEVKEDDDEDEDDKEEVKEDDDEDDKEEVKEDDDEEDADDLNEDQMDSPTALDPKAAVSDADQNPANGKGQKSADDSHITEDDDEDEDEDDKEEVKEDDDKPWDDEEEKKAVKEHVDKLFRGESLTEGFQTKARTIFETAVSQVTKAARKRLQESYNKKLKKQSKAIKEDLATKLDDYLGYVVEEWMKENRVAIDAGLRSEITEEFLGGLRRLFKEHYIEVPNQKADILKDMARSVLEYDRKLNESVAREVKMSRRIKALERQSILSRLSEGLTDTQKSKLRQLTENVDFSDSKTFESKVKVLKESYVTGSKRVLTEDRSPEQTGESDGATNVRPTDNMDKYLDAAERLNKHNK